MATDPGDLVLDPTCGSGTTAYVAEQWGRRWITIDTSRVALALARARIMGARYPYYLLADSREGQLKEAEVTRTAPSSQPVTATSATASSTSACRTSRSSRSPTTPRSTSSGRSGRQTLEPLREKLNAALKKNWQEWEIPREVDAKWSDAAKKLHAEWWQARIARQKEIDASIAAKAEFEYLYDKPYEDKKTVRVAGPFTVESLSPHRVLGVDENDELIDPARGRRRVRRASRPFPQMILENLKTAGVQQAHKEDRITFTVAHALARRSRLRRRALPGRRHRETRRHLHRPGVRHRHAPRSRRGRPRGRRCRFRRPDRLRLQLRGPLHRVQQARPHPRAQGAHERRPAHGRRPEEHRQGQPLRHLRRAGHRHPAARRTARSA